MSKSKNKTYLSLIAIFIACVLYATPVANASSSAKIKLQIHGTICTMDEVHAGEEPNQSVDCVQQEDPATGTKNPSPTNTDNGTELAGGLNIPFGYTLIWLVIIFLVLLAAYFSLRQIFALLARSRKKKDKKGRAKPRTNAASRNKTKRKKNTQSQRKKKR